jgi:hypothetical protein
LRCRCAEASVLHNAGATAHNATNTNDPLRDVLEEGRCCP